MSTYQPGIPTGTVDLDVDYLNIQNNFTQLDTSFGIDHVTFSNQTPQNGYHQDIHFNPVSTTVTNPPNNYNGNVTQYPLGFPATVAGFGQLFSSSVNDAANVDTGLYWLTGAGRKIALTRNITPTYTNNGNNNGYTFLPGGIILQWGVVDLAAGQNQTGTVLFNTNNMNFPTRCWSVQCTLVSKVGGTTSSSNTIAIRNFGLTQTQFVWDYNGSSSAYDAFFWLAMGV